MGFKIRRVDYFYVTVHDQPGEGYRLLSLLANEGINLVAFTAVPVGPMHTQLSLFPDDPSRLETVARRANLTIDGPHPALLVQGNDELGALAEIHAKLNMANVNVFASTAVSNGSGDYGYVIYIRPEAIQRAESALEI